MASLTGNLVAETYKALLKTIDNDILTASEKQITDGFGGGSNVFIDSNGFLRANKYKVTNGLATQFLKADGSLDANTYLTSITSSQIITALGFTPVTNARTLTINGTTYDLSANRSWTVGGTAAVWGNITGTLSNQTDLQTALNAKFNNPSGTISQYIRGDGSLATFPTITGLLPAGGTTGQILAKIDATNYNTHWIDNYATQTKNEVKLGQTLTKGTAVYVSSANGTNIIVSAASNASEALSSKTFGLLETGGATNDFVKCVTFGLLAGLDTSTATEGDPVWLGVNGALIFGLANKPYAPAHLVYIGVVTRVQSNNGEIFVNVQNGFELREIHDVLAQSPTNNDGLFYESSTSLWKNKSISTVLGYTPANGANYLALTGGTLSGNLTISNSNPKLFLTDTDNNPDFSIQNYNGTFKITDETNSADRLIIYSTGIGYYNGDFKANKLYVDGGTSSQFIKGDGTLDANTYLTSSALDGYLAKAGGTMTGDLNFYTLKTTRVGGFAYIRGSWQGTYWGIGASATGHTIIIDQVDFSTGAYESISDINLMLGTRTVLHSSNFGSYALPLTGGTLTGSITATSFIKTGGTSNDYLRADGSVSTITGDIISGTGSAGYIPRFSSTSVLSSSVIYTDGTSVGISSTSLNYGGYGRTLTGAAFGSLSFGFEALGLSTTNGALLGGLSIIIANNDSTRRIGSAIQSYLSGSTATNQGADLRFYAKPDNGVLLEVVRMTSSGITFNKDLTAANITATSFIKSGGLSNQFLMADGSVSTYTNPVTGTGSATYIPKWTSASNLGSSNMSDNGTSIGISSTQTNYDVYGRTLTGAAFGSASFGFEAIGLTTTNGGLLGGFSIVVANNDSSRYIGAAIKSNLVGTTSTNYGADLRFYAKADAGVIGEVARMTSAGLRVYGIIVKDGGTSSQFLMADGSVTTGVANPVGGTGTTNYLSKWTSGNTLGNSLIFETTGFANIAGDLKIESLEPQIYLNKTGTDAGTWRILGSTGQTLRRFRIYDEQAALDRFDIFSNGNVSIGTTTDSGYKFDVNGTGRFSGALNGTSASFSSSVTANGAKSQFIADGGASYGAGISLNTALSGTDRRNWFIGTEENIIGDFVIKSSISSGGSGNSGNTRLSILNNGNVGIGINSPLSKLHVGDGSQSAINGAGNKIHIASATSAGRSALITLANSSGGTTVEGQFESSAESSDLRIIIGSTSNHPVQFRANNADAMRIVSGGNIGIGTTSPTNYSGFTTLHVNGKSGTNGGVLRLTAFDSSSSVNIYAGGSAINFNTTSAVPFIWLTQDTERMRITNDGIIQFSTTSSIPTTNNSIYSYSGNGYLYIQGGSTGLGLSASGSRNNIIYINETSNFIRFDTNNSGERMRISSGGNVLINTTTDSGYKLDVNGITRASNYYLTGGYNTPNGLVVNGDTNWTFGCYNDGGAQYYMQVKFSGTGDDNRGFRVFNQNGSTVEFRVNGIGNGIFRGSVTGTAFYESSDMRLKTLIDESAQIAKIENLEAKLYEKNGKIELGYFAQDAEKLMPYAVTKGTDGFLSLSYREVHTAKIARLEKEVAQLKAQLNIN
jgi:hypothetical protein